VVLAAVHGLKIALLHRALHTGARAVEDGVCDRCYIVQKLMMPARRGRCSLPARVAQQLHGVVLYLLHPVKMRNCSTTNTSLPSYRDGDAGGRISKGADRAILSGRYHRCSTFSLTATCAEDALHR
jgi:hypothetical protein